MRNGSLTLSCSYIGRVGVSEIDRDCFFAYLVNGSAFNTFVVIIICRFMVAIRCVPVNGLVFGAADIPLFPSVNRRSSYGYLEKLSFRSNSALRQKYYSWNISYMPVVKFLQAP